MDHAAPAAKQHGATRATVPLAGQIWTTTGLAHRVSSVRLKFAGSRLSRKSKAEQNQKPGPPAQGRETG